MTLKRSDLVSHVTLNLGNRNNLSTYILTWINWAIQDTASVFNWRSMKKLLDQLRTESGKVWYPMPANIKDITDVSIIDGSSTISLTYKPPDVFRKQFPHPEEDGNSTPVYYTWEGEYLRFYPLCDDDNLPIYIMAALWPEELTTDNDAFCPLPKLEQEIISRATYIGAKATGDTIKMRTFSPDSWLRGIGRIARVDGHPSDWTPQYASERVTRDYRTGEFRVPPLGHSTLQTINV